MSCWLHRVLKMYTAWYDYDIDDHVSIDVFSSIKILYHSIKDNQNTLSIKYIF